MKHWLMPLLLLLGVASLFAARMEIPKLWNPQEGIYTAGQPTEEGFQQLADMGIKTVINVLPERCCDPDESEIVTSRGMLYRTVPFSLTDFKKGTVLQFAEILDHAKKPLLIHCSTGNHVGGLWFSYRVLMEKAPVEEALREARIIGLSPDLEKRLVDWIYTQR
jgi:uncharacterized protein (TIGR01244 family)